MRVVFDDRATTVVVGASVVVGFSGVTVVVEPLVFELSFFDEHAPALSRKRITATAARNRIRAR